jgi:HlyD family secretion protein
MIPSDNPALPLARPWDLTRMALGAPRFLVQLVRANSWLSLTLGFTAATVAALVVAVVVPGYTSPMSRLYTSKFGQAAMLRRLDRPFPVTSTRPARRLLGRTCLGEGLIRTEPLVVPVIPLGIIQKVHVRDGEDVKKGQLLAELDPIKGRIKFEAAEAALVTAKAEFERVKIGSSYVLTYERPLRDQIRLQNAERQLVLQQQLLEIELRLIKKGYGHKALVLQQQVLVTQAENELREAKFNLGMSTNGVKQSLSIAESAVKEAELALEHRRHELDEFKIIAIADGRIERCLIHEGEYNQDPGKPGFVIAAGSWFEANFDQGAYRRVGVGHHAEVRLEAAPERVLSGTVTWVNPFVSYDLGGPESNRPVRPMGTGTPEWPATFIAKLDVEGVEGVPLLPGMTGFALIKSQGEALCLPREAVFAITTGKGMVYLIDGSGFRPREVTLGVVDGDFIEIREGLDPYDEVILDGHQVLEPGDKIEVAPAPRKGGSRA